MRHDEKFIKIMRKMKNHQYLSCEILTRLGLLILTVLLEYIEPFQRKIHPEETWLYKNPRTLSYVPTKMLFAFVFLIPMMVIFISNLLTKSKHDGLQAFLACTLTLGINGVMTNTIKIIVGRPRPDFYYRCFPDGKGDFQFPCTGNQSDVIEGMKSFPSGHSSFAFASMTFCTLYICGKLHVFSHRGHDEAWRLLVAFLPFMLALMTALSRTCDYHHHWQDVLGGSILGLSIAWMCYFQSYPSLNHSNCHIPYRLSKGDETEQYLKKSESLEDIAVKWI